MDEFKFKDSDLVSVGQKLRVFRKLNKMSQLDAEIAGDISHGGLSRIETGSVNPSRETIYNLCKVYNLDLVRIEYLIGATSKLPTEVEIKNAQDNIREYMEKPLSFAYMMDERGRLFYLSKGFRTLANISEKKHEELMYVPMPLIILEERYGIKSFLEGIDYEKIIKVGFYRTYTEINFMIGDPVYKVIMEAVKKNKFVKNFWENIKKGIDIQVISSDLSMVPFNYKGMKIEMQFSSEKLISNSRFKILDYRPNNKLLQIIQDII